MTHSIETDSLPAWGIEIERVDGESEFYSVATLQVGSENFHITTSGGTQVSFKNHNIRKVLMMRTKMQEGTA